MKKDYEVLFVAVQLFKFCREVIGRGLGDAIAWYCDVSV